MKTNGISLDQVMAIVGRGAATAHGEDLRDAKADVEKTTAERAEIKAKLKEIDASNEELADMERGNTGLLKTFVDDTIGGFLGFRNEAKTVRKGRAANLQASKAAQQKDVVAEEKLGKLQQEIRDTQEAFSSSGSVVQNIESQQKKLHQSTGLA